MPLTSKPEMMMMLQAAAANLAAAAEEIAARPRYEHRIVLDYGSPAFLMLLLLFFQNELLPSPASLLASAANTDAHTPTVPTHKE